MPAPVPEGALPARMFSNSIKIFMSGFVFWHHSPGYTLQKALQPFHPGQRATLALVAQRDAAIGAVHNIPLA